MTTMAAKPDRKDAILNAMLELIAERGFHDAPISLLAKRSGTSAGVIYHHFRSKEDIIHALYRRVHEVKNRISLEGYSTTMASEEAYVHIWMNAYRFYRTHQNETRFLEQYESSPFCGHEVAGPKVKEDEITAHFRSAFRIRRVGGFLKDLPPEAIQELSFGLAARLAARAEPLKPAMLRRIAAASWQAIADE